MEGMLFVWEKYPESVRDVVVNFPADFVIYDTHKFSGKVQEDENGIPEMSEIEGSINGLHIVFDKTYSKTYFMDARVL